MKNVCLIIFSLLVFTPNFLFAQSDPFGEPDTLRITTIEVNPYSSFSIPVHLFNDEALMGLTIPILLTNEISGILIDSVLFNLERIGNCHFYNAQINSNRRSVLIGIIPSLDSSDIDFESGEGAIFEIYCSVGEINVPLIDTITTRSLPPFNTIRFVGDDITPFVPEFIPGFIHLTTANINDHSGFIENHPNIFEVYPNPFNGKFILKINSLEERYFDLKIYNILGQIIYEDDILVSTGVNIISPIDLMNNPSGVYFIKITNSSYNEIIKILLLK